MATEWRKNILSPLCHCGFISNHPLVWTQTQPSELWKYPHCMGGSFCSRSQPRIANHQNKLEILPYKVLLIKNNHYIWDQPGCKTLFGLNGIELLCRHVWMLRGWFSDLKSSYKPSQIFAAEVQIFLNLCLGEVLLVSWWLQLGWRGGEEMEAGRLQSAEAGDMTPCPCL